MSNKINIGLDIGVTSVGWSIIDNNYKIIDMGVRLFDDPANPNDGTLGNEKRRTARSIRRQIRRTKLRKHDLISFLVENNFGSECEIQNIIENFDITKYGFDHPAQLKQKALTNKITKEELIFILFHYIHHRGSFNLTESDLKEGKIKINKNNTYPSIQMVEFFKKNKYFTYRNINDEIFLNIHWQNEIKKALETQECDNEFIDKYLEIFKRTREFNKGPGSEKSPTKYGLYQWQYNKNTCKWEITNNGYKNLWDRTIGKCTWYKNENRGLKNSPCAEVFNLFNDINNIYLLNDNDKKLSEKVKHKIFCKLSDSFFSDKSVYLSRKLICNILNEENIDNKYKCEDICGCRTEGKDKVIFTKLENYYILGRYLRKYNKNFNNNNLNALNVNFLKECDDLFKELASEHDIIKRIEILSNRDELKKLSKDENEKIIKKMNGLSSSHSLSTKAMFEFIEYCIKHLDKSINQQQFYIDIIKNKIEPNSNTTENISKYLKHGMFDNEILSPTVRRAFNQTILVFNKILKVYRKKYDIDNIIIELPRDKNSHEQKKKIDKLNKENKDLILKAIGNETSVNYEKLSIKQKNRLKLWYQQEKKDIYDNQIINFNDVITGKNLDEDHIIPWSISHDNSINNKVLTKSINNSNKNNLTPYLWLSKSNRYNNFKKNVNDLYSKKLINEEKMKNLLYEKNPLDDIFHFIGRNLADTRYIAALILQQFKNFFDNNNNYKNVKIKVVRGAITTFARYNLFIDKHQNKKTLLPKDRDLYCHHAIDASIICFLGMNSKINQMLNYYHMKCMSSNNNIVIDKDTHKMINKMTGEIVNLDQLYDMQQINDFSKELSKYNDTNDSFKNRVHFSRGIISKNNVALSDETIYSYNDKQKIYYSQLDLIKEKTSTLNKYFSDENSKKTCKLLIKKYDYCLFEKLKNIYLNYSQTNKMDKNTDSLDNNPFISYMINEYKIDHPKFIQIENQKIKKLRLINKIESEKIILPCHNNKAIIKSLNCLYWRIYKNNKNKFIIFPINAKVVKNITKYNNTYLKIDDEKLYDKLSFENIDEKNKYINIYRGTILINKKNNDIFYICGGIPSQNKFELKWLNAINAKHQILKNNKPPIRYLLTINPLTTDFDIAQIDPLGRIYNRYGFDDWDKLITIYNR